MPIKHVNTVKSTLQDSVHPYLNDCWKPLFNEYDATDMQVIGEIPKDVDGVYLRNSEVQINEPIGRYHPFDGDGMIHSFSLKDGKARYCNRFVRTKGMQAEQEAGESLWAGLMERPSRSKRQGWGAQEGLKDSSSTDVIVHAGKVISTFYQCGEGYRLDPYTLEQFGTESWAPIDGISAHPKLDESTGELLFFNYSKHAPYMHYGVVGPDNKLKHYVPIPLKGPRLPHDMAFTKNYAILNDMPLYWDPEALKQNIHAARFFKDEPSRFAIIPRLGQPEDIKWFEADPTYTLHWINAWEEGDEVVLDGYFQESPEPPSFEGAPPGMERMMAYLSQGLMKPKLHRWRFNLKTGETVEERLDDRILEFGTINHKFDTQRHRYVYSAIPTPDRFQFDGLTRNDMQTGETQDYMFGEGRYGSEPGFAPRIGGSDEDDGYVVSIIMDVKADTSEFVMLDAKNIAAGPVCRVMLPERISSGTHSTWAHGEDIRNSQALMRKLA